MDQHPDLIAMVTNQRNAERLQLAEQLHRRQRREQSQPRRGGPLRQLVRARAARTASGSSLGAFGRAA